VAGGSSVDDSANLCKIALLSVGLGGSDGIASASAACSLVVGYGGRSGKQEDHAAVRPAWHGMRASEVTGAESRIRCKQVGND
jgi:hypothetical protein